MNNIAKKIGILFLVLSLSIGLMGGSNTKQVLSMPTAQTAPKEEEQTAEPSPEPTDPLDIYFTKSGEDIQINEDMTDWLYRSPKLYVHIVKYDNKQEKLKYYIADIRTRNGEIIKSGFSDEKHPGSNALLPYLVARKYNAVFLQNGDYFEDKRNPTGVIIRQGKVYRDKEEADTLAVMPDGTLKIYAAGEINAQGLLDLGVVDTFSFGPSLIIDGKINPNIKKHPLRGVNPRSGIGMIENGHYISIVVEGRNPNSSNGVTLEKYAQMFADEGCTVAYNLDGGASSAMVFMGETLNKPTDILTTKTYRRVPDVLMIGTSDSVPDSKE